MTNETIARLRLASIGIIVAAVVVLAACQPGVSIQQRIDTFNSQVSKQQYDQLYTNWASNTNTYASFKLASAWNSTPFYSTENPSAITLTDTSNPGNVTGTFSDKTYSYAVTLVMVQQGNNWYISSMTLTPPSPAAAITFN